MYPNPETTALYGDMHSASAIANNQNKTTFFSISAAIVEKRVRVPDILHSSENTKIRRDVSKEKVKC